VRNRDVDSQFLLTKSKHFEAEKWRENLHLIVVLMYCQILTTHAKKTYRNWEREFIPWTRDWKDWINANPCYWNHRLKQSSWKKLSFACLPQSAEIVLNLAICSQIRHSNLSASHSNFELRVVSRIQLELSWISPDFAVWLQSNSTRTKLYRKYF